MTVRPQRAVSDSTDGPWDYFWACAECIEGAQDTSRVGARQQGKVHAQKTGHQFWVGREGEEFDA